jgi:hypothetical protein
MTGLLVLVLFVLFVSGCATAPGRPSGPSFQDKPTGAEGGSNGGMGPM